MDITNQQIRRLRQEALGAGDYRMVDICNRALVRDDDTVDQDGNVIPFAEWTQVEAVAEIARVIADAKAQEP